MKENIKYYQKFNLQYLLSMLTVLFLTLFISLMDIFGDSINVFWDWLSWILIVLSTVLIVIFLLLIVQALRKVSYITLMNEKVHMINILGVEKSCIIKGKFKVKKNGNKIKFIILYGNENRPQLLIGDVYEISLIDLEKLLIKIN